MGEYSKSLKEFIEIGKEYQKQDDVIREHLNLGTITQKDLDLILKFMNSFLKISYKQNEIINLINRYKSKIEMKQKEDPNFKPQFDIDVQKFINDKMKIIDMLEIKISRKWLIGGYKSELLEAVEKEFYGKILNKDFERLKIVAACVGATLISCNLILKILEHADQMFK